MYPGAARSHVTSYQQEDQSVLPLTCKNISKTRGPGGPHTGSSQATAPPNIPTSTAPTPEFLRVTGHTISPAPVIAPLTAMSEILSSATLDPLQEHQTSKVSVKKSTNPIKARKEKVKCLKSNNPLKVKFKFQCPSSSSGALQTLATKAQKRKSVVSHSTVHESTETTCPTSDRDESPHAIDEDPSPSIQGPSVAPAQQLATSTQSSGSSNGEDEDNALATTLC